MTILLLKILKNARNMKILSIEPYVMYSELQNRFWYYVLSLKHVDRVNICFVMVSIPPSLHVVQIKVIYI